MKRRQFLQDTLAGSSLLAASALGWAPRSTAAPARRQDMPYGVLGRTGVRVSRLGIGTAPLQRRQVSIDDARAVLYRALEHGVNYIDTAPNYGNAEEKIGHTVKEIRDRIFLVTKTEEPTYEGTWRLLRQSLGRLQTDHLDLVHLHNLGHEGRFEDLAFVFSDRGALGALREARAQGVVRFIGASGHLYPSRFHAALDTGEIDVVMNAVNFVLRHVYDFEHKVWSRARRENLGLVAMKVLGGARGGAGFRLPEAFYTQAVRYALSLEGLSTAVIGIENLDELEQAVAAVVGATPLTGEEADALAREGLALAQTPAWRAPHGEPLT